MRTCGRGLLLLLALLLPPNVANAQLINTNALIGSGPNKTLSVFTQHTAVKDGVNIMVFATDTANTKSIAMKGDGASLVTCLSYSCNYTWPRASMVQRRCVSCELLVTVTNNDNSTYRMKLEVTRP